MLQNITGKPTYFIFLEEQPLLEALFGQASSGYVSVEMKEIKMCFNND